MPPDEVVVDVQNVVVQGHQPPPDIPSKRVKLGDLDLTTVKGACTALRRIENAAGDVCPFDGERDLSMITQRKRCVTDSVTRAVQSTHSTKLVSLQDHGC
jgi:UrcA family protein